VYFLFRPDLIEYNKLTKANPVQSLNNAFNVADQKLGLTPLLDAEGKIVYIICIWKFCICIVSSWVASWCCGRVSDSRSRGRGFESRPGTTA